jgi:hypothetical protein
VNSIIPFEETWEAYFAEHGKSLKRNIKKPETEFGEVGGPELPGIQRHRGARKRFLVPHGHREKELEMEDGDPAGRPRVPAFLRELLEVASACGWLKLEILELGS